MAQEKLLFILVLLLFFGSNARAVEQFEFNKSDLEFAGSISQIARQSSMSAIKEKWLELKKMTQGQNETNQDKLEDSEQDYALSLKPSSSLKVFVSSSMPKELLKNYLEQAKKYKATLVFRGLQGGSWRKTSELIYEITGGKDEGASIQLDDMAFNQYSVTSVPTFVLVNEKDVFEASGRTDDEAEFDKVSGNVGIKPALELMASGGDNQDTAALKLRNLGVEE
ncbi:MAG: type-F conjugative transfer system pilin assembly protein TrbC [Proteobacteria bacterium]|nr:type-F conjugative transfer system pilin assembly protein TrbC [Pseudomonadota bacterium]